MRNASMPLTVSEEETLAKDPVTRSVWQTLFEQKLRRRFTVLSSAVAALAIVGILIAWGPGRLSRSSSSCGLVASTAEAHEPDCKSNDRKPAPAP